LTGSALCRLVRPAPMASADSSPPIPPSCNGSITKAEEEVSQGKVCHLHPIYPSHLHPSLPDDYRALNLLAFLPRNECPGTRLRVMRFVYLGPGVCVPLPSDPASRRQPLRFGSWFPSSGSIEDFHLQVSAPCRAHQKMAGPLLTLPSDYQY
jgi:hypothetical protein